MKRLLVIAVAAAAYAANAIGAQAVALSQGSEAIAKGKGGLSSTLVTVSIRDVRVAEAIRTVAKQAGLRVTFGDKVLGVSSRVTVKAENVAAEKVLEDILKGTGIVMSVTPTGQLFFDLASKKQNNGQGVVSGKVTDAKTGKGISGASVSLGEGRNVQTDEDGSYRLTGVPVGTHTVFVRLVGYAKQTRQVVVGEEAVVTVDFKLEPSANVLDQVVVTGSVVATELRAIPNAITVITAKQIEERGITRIDQLFRGDVPGLFAVERGTFGSIGQVAMFSRGATVLEPNTSTPNPSSNAIKTYVDGVEIADPSYLSQIDPKSIERIEILTGPQASTIYGSNAINGVMQIFTKRGSGSRPQLTLLAQTGGIQNNFSSRIAPEHEASAQLGGC